MLDVTQAQNNEFPDKCKKTIDTLHKENPINRNVLQNTINRIRKDELEFDQMTVEYCIEAYIREFDTERTMTFNEILFKEILGMIPCSDIEEVFLMFTCCDFLNIADFLDYFPPIVYDIYRSPLVDNTIIFNLDVTIELLNELLLKPFGHEMLK